MNDSLLNACLVVGGVSLFVALVGIVWSRRQPAPDSGEPARVLLGSPMAGRAFLYLSAVMVPAMAIGILVPIAAKEWYPDTWLVTAGVLFAASWLPLSVWPMLVMTERGARAAALGEGTVLDDVLTISWGEDSRRLNLLEAAVQLRFGIPGAGGDLGSLEILVDDGSLGPQGRSGPARLVVSLPLASRGWLGRRGLDVVPMVQPSGLPILGWGREVEVFLDRILDRAVSVTVLPVR